MQSIKEYFLFFACCLITMILCSCSSPAYFDHTLRYESSDDPPSDAHYTSRLPASIDTGERTVLVNPRAHVFGAYDENGRLVRSGLASAGSSWCNDLHRPCHTQTGTYRVFYMGDADCISTRFPIPTGGAPMPYCMYFNGNQALHGVSNSKIGEGNYSHGCVRLHVSDAEWLRYHFVDIGTKVVIEPY